MVDLPASAVHVLVVDDDIDTAETTALLFRSENLEVQTAYDGAAALKAAKQQLPDLILLDLAMPFASGYEVARDLEFARPPRPPFLVAMSGYGQPRDKRRCAEAGFDVHLTKPVDARILLRLMALLNDTEHPSCSAQPLLVRTSPVQAEVVEILLNAVGQLIDVAATTRNPITKRRSQAKATRLRGLIERNLEAERKTEIGPVLLQVVLEDALDSALGHEQAQMGSIQLLNSQGGLEIATQRGFDPKVLSHLTAASADDCSASGRALRHRATVGIEDVQVDVRYAAHRAVAASAHFRAVCSSPLIVPDGSVLGVLSTHFAQPHVFSVPEIEAHGHRARHTASLINWASEGPSADTAD